MNLSDARSALRWAVFNPNAAEAAGNKMMESIPQVMTTVGAYMLSEWLSKRYGQVFSEPGEKPQIPSQPIPTISIQTIEGPGGQL